LLTFLNISGGTEAQIAPKIVPNIQAGLSIVFCSIDDNTRMVDIGEFKNAELTDTMQG